MWQGINLSHYIFKLNVPDIMFFFMSFENNDQLLKKETMYMYAKPRYKNKCVFIKIAPSSHPLGGQEVVGA